MNINVRKPGHGQVLVVIADDKAYSAYVLDREDLDHAVYPEGILKVTLEEMDKQLESYRADFEYVYILERGDKLEFGCTACKTFMSPVNAKVSVKKGTPEMEILLEHARTEHDGANFTVRHMDGEPYECNTDVGSSEGDEDITEFGTKVIRKENPVRLSREEFVKKTRETDRWYMTRMTRAPEVTIVIINEKNESEEYLSPRRDSMTSAEWWIFIDEVWGVSDSPANAASAEGGPGTS